MESNLKKCSKCKKNYDLEHYTKGDKILKSCLKCRNNVKKSRIKNKCRHNKIKYVCIDCRGSSICIHSKEKSHCKLCNNPIDITIKYMISNSKKKDKKKNRYNETEFVDYQYLFNLIDISNDICYYCDCLLQYTNYSRNLATIERLDNVIGHTKNNVVIACRTCNLSNIGHR